MDKERLTTVISARVSRATAASLATMAQENRRDMSEIMRFILDRAARRWREKRQVPVSDVSAPGQDAGADPL